MNKQCFRVIFSKTLQRLVVVSELAKSEGKSTEPSASGAILQKICKMRPLVFSLFCAFGFVTFSNNVLAETLIIQADKSAPKNQQPIILQTANGLPQVNIQTPNDKGLSHNKYSQFDIAEKGAILNNSRTNTQTQQAGMIQANPYLARGEAKVILNEVNSNKPSVMKGYVEVAGKKAEVIIANPSGLHCEGCGIINSDRATFTTGKPEIKNGQVDNFKVEAGKVKISGKGLDNSRVDYTEIIAREAEVNAGIWSKKETKVITGKNTVKRSETDKTLQIIHTNQPLAGEVKPQVAIDVGELGGMYSGKIHLIGTENGVGVRNAGHIGASAETLQIDSQGRIVNTGTINAAKPVTLTASNGIENKGKIENKQGDIQLKSNADIQNSGSIVARSGNIQKKSETTIQQSGETLAKGNITYRASTIHTTKDSLIAAGVEVTDTAQGETRKLEEKSENGKTVQLNSSGKTTAQGKNIASGKITISASEIDANLSQNNAHTIEYTAKSGDIQADNARLTAEQIHLTTPNLLSTQGSFLTAEVINTSQKSLNAQNAVWKQTGEQDFHLTGENINTQGGEFSTQGNFFINAKQLENQQGTLSSGKSLSLDLTGYLNSTDGKLFAGENLTLNSQNLNNDNGLIYAKQKIGITVKNGLVSNKNTNSTYKGIVAGKELLLESQAFDNTKGQITSEHIGLTTSQINNVEGAIRAEHNADINADTLFNHKGIVSSVQNANLTVSEISQQKGIIEAQHLQLNSNTLTSTENSLIFAEQLNLTTKGELNNQDSHIVAKKGAYLTTGSNVTNIRGVVGSQTADLQLNTHNHQINNTEGKIVAAQKLNVRSGSLSNEQGLITANNISLDTNNSTLNNQNTLTSQKDKGIIGLDKLSLNHLSLLNNEKGFIHSNKQLAISATSHINNQQGILNSKENLTLNATQIDNKAGTISAKIAEVNAKSIDNNAVSNVGSLILGTTQLVLNTEQLANQNTKRKNTDIAPIQGIQAGQLTLNSNTLSNQQGGIYVADIATITVNQALNNLQGELLSDNELIIKEGGNLSLNNQEGLIQAKNRINLSAKTLEQEGKVKTQGDLTVRLKDSFTLNKAFEVGNDLNFSTQGDFTNNVALLIGNSATLSANQIVNAASGEISSKNSKLKAKEITNRGLIDGEKTLLNASKITNIGTGRIYGDHLSFDSFQLINREENGSSATIGARERLDLGVNNMINSNGGTIISLGTMHFGKELDENHQAVGLSDSVQNHNAVIEALGRISFNVKGVENLHKLLKLEIKETSKTPVFEYSFGNESPRYSKDTEGLVKIKRDDQGSFNKKVENLYALRLSDGRESEEWREYNYIRTINESMIVPSVYSEAKIISGDKIDFYYSDVKNHDSKIIANTGIEYHQDAKIDNNSTAGVILTTEKGKITQFYNGEACAKKIFGKCIDHYRTTKSNTFNYNQETNSTKTFDLWDYNPNKNGKVVLDKELGAQTRAKNVSLDTISITGSDTELNSSTVNIKLTPTINDQDKNTIVDSGQVVGKLDKTVDDFDVNKLGELEMPTIKTHLADIRLPQASLYKINPDSPNGYLVETDPKFTDRKQWLSSDYMFEQLRHNVDNVHKRLGDGFYEQRLINEQINQLTGRRFIQGYNNDLEQYKALMNNGVKYAKEFNLAVGVGLTAKQMSELTTDMVWLVNKEITLADGRKVTALVPQVYLVARNSDITSRGAVISANQIIGNVDNLQNSGVIAGLDLTRLHSNQLENRGTILGDTVDLSAKQNLINLGGKIEAVKELSLYAGKNLEISSTLSSSQSADGNFARTVLDQLASVKVTGEGGRLTLHSDDNLTIKAANIESQGSLTATTDKALSITTLNVSNKEHYNGNADNYYRLNQQSEIGSTLRGKDGVHLVGMENATLRQATVSSESGETFIGSKGDVRIESGEQSEQLASSSKGSSKGWFSKTTETRRHYHDTTENIGSEIDGNHVTLYSETGKVDIHGSAVVADTQLVMDSKEGVNITSATNTHYAEDEQIKTKSGLMGTGGIGFSVGKKKEQIEQDHRQQSAARSQVGSLSGDTIIRTDGHYQQTGSVVTSRDGDVDITAKSANITAARSDYESNYKRTYEQKGVTVAVNIPVVQAIQAVEKTVNSAKSVGSSKNDRINALGAVNAGFEAWRTAEQVGKLAEAMGQNPAQSLSQDVSVSITYGEQKSVETQHSKGNKAEKSQINAGGKVNIKTEGSGKNSTLTIAGSDVSGKGGTHLKAEGDVNILAVDENHLERSKNKSSGFNAGVAISYGSSGFAFGVTAGGNVAKGYGNGESQAWVGSQVGSLDSRTTIESGGDANIIGSQVKGKSVKVSAEKLNIHSLQDTMKYEGKQESASGQVTVGYGASGSASYSKSKMNADMATVGQQAGIFAGDEGYDVDIQNHTELTAGLVTSTEKAEAEGKNRFSTGTLNATNLDNHANYKGSSVGVSASAAANFDTPLGDKGQAQSSKTVKDESSNPVLATGAESLQAGVNVGYGSDSDSQSSQTQSGINTKNLTVRNEQAQIEKTGKTAEQIKAAVKTDITTETAESRSGKLENRFDKDKLQKELDYQVKATQEFQTISMATINEKVATHAENKRAEAEQAKAEGNLAKARELENEAKKWETGGAYRQGVDAVTNAIGLALGGSPTAGVVTGAISPYINTEIKQATEGNTEANLIAHAIWGAVEAYTQGGKAGAGAAAAVTGEVGAKLISEQVFGKTPENLTEAEKKTVSELSQVAAGLAGGLSASGGNSLSTAQAVKTGQGIGKNAVENNYLTKQEAERKHALDEKAKAGTITTEEELEHNAIAQKDIETDLALSVCEENWLSTQCQSERQKLEQAKFSYSGAEYTPTGYNYPTYTRYSDLYPEDYEKVATFSEHYDVLKNAKIKADSDFYNATGIDPSWFGRVDIANNVIASIAGTRLATTEPSKATQVMPKSVSANEKLPVVGKSTGYEEQVTRISNPYSPYLEIDKYGNEIYYRTLSTRDYKILQDTGVIPPTSETFISPLATYSRQYEGVLVKFTTKPGTSLSLQDIGVTGNSATKRFVFPDMPRANKGWINNDKAQFKLEGTNKPDINNGYGVVNTGLGKSEALYRFNENIIKFETIEK